MAAKQVAPDRQNPAQKQEKPSATQEAAPKARAVPDLSGPISPARARGAQGVAGNDAVSRAVGPKGPATGGKASGGDAPPKANGGPAGPGGLGGAVQAAAGFVMRAAGAGRAAPAMNGDGPPRGGGDGAAAPNGGGGAGGPVDLGRHQGQRPEAPSGGGNPLPSGVRGEMEGSFGVDFGGVRVHMGADSEKLTAQVGADALTMGADIHFGKGKFDPGSQGGKKLLAHELTHVVQQGGGSPRGGSEKGAEGGKGGPKVKGRTGGKKRQPKLTIGSSGDAHEAEADRVAGQVVGGGQAGTVGGASGQASRKASAGKGGGARGAIEGFVALKPSQRARQWTGLSGQVNVGLQADVQTTNEGKPEIHARLGVGVSGATKGAPEGSPKKAAEGKGGEVKGPGKEAGNVPKAPQPTLTQIPALTRPAPVVAVPKDATPEQGQAAAQRAFAGISTNASVNTTAGARPKVPKAGDADPSKAETKRKEATQEADTARNKAKQEVDQGRGTEVVKDLLMDEVNKVKDTVAEAMKETPPVEGMEKFKEKGLPPDVEAKFDEQQQAVMEASLADARSQVDEASAKKDTDKQAEFEKAKAESEKLSQAAQAEHDTAVQQARGDITKAREETKAEQDKAYADLDKETQARHKDELSAIDAKVSSTESQIEGEFTKAESQANQEVRKAEQEAAQKKKDEEEKAKNRSWWDSVKDAVSDVFDAIASAITKVLNAVRDLVKGILDKVKTWATSIIDAATTWITDRIKQFAGWLKERVTQIVGAVFPKLAEKLNKAIDAAADWACKKVQQVGEGLKKAVTSLCDAIGAALDKIIAVFQQALDMALAIMEAALTGDWAALGLKVLEAVLALAGIPKEEFMAVVGQGEETIDKIVDDPGGFLGNMIDAVGQGFGQFSDNFLSHLQNGFLEWLTKTAAAAGVATLGSMELGDIFGWVLETLGVDKGYIRGKAVKVLGEENVDRVEWVMDVIGTAMEGGWDGLWEYMQGYVDGFYDLVIGQIQDFVMTRVIQAAVIKIASMFNPVGAIVQAIITAWNVYEFLRDQIQRIFGVVKAVVGSIHDLAFGNIGGAANMIEGALGKLVPIAIDLLAKVLGLGGIPEKVSGIIGKVREKIDGAIDKVIDKIKAGFKKGADWIQGKGSKKEGAKTEGGAEDKKGEGKPGDAAKAGDVASELEKPVEFSAGGESHKTWIVVQGDTTVTMVASTPMSMKDRVQVWREKLKERPDEERKRIGGAIGKAIAIERDVARASAAAAKDKDPSKARAVKGKQQELAVATGEVFALLPEHLRSGEESKGTAQPEDEKSALPAGAATPASDDKAGADMRKVLPNNPVGQRPSGQPPAAGAANKNADETVAALSLDYEQGPNKAGDRPAAGKNPKGATGDKDAGATAGKPHANQEARGDDAMAAAGATPPGALDAKGKRRDGGAGGQGGLEVAESGAPEKPGVRPGDDKTIATLKQKRDAKGEVVYDSAGKPILDWEVNRELGKQERGSGDKQKAVDEKAEKKETVAPELKKSEAEKKAVDPVDPKADEHKKISKEIDDKAKKQGDVKQGSADLDRLYAEAEHAYNELKSATAEIAGQTGGAAKFPPGLKGKERALEKINADYKGDASKLFDIARSSIEFTSLDALYKALDMVQGRFTVVRIKDRFQSPTKSGYRDMLLNLKTSNGHICEMQLHVEQILAVKNGEGHKLYEETRSLEAKAAKENRPLSEQEKNQISAADGKAKTLYDNAYADSLKPGEKKPADKADDKQAAKEPVDPKATEHKAISQGIGDKAKKQGEVKQSSADLDKLYQEAEVANEELRNATVDIAGATNGKASLPPGLKGRKRAQEKIDADYKGDASKLFDIARSSIEFRSLDDLYQALTMIEGRFTVVRIKDRFQAPTKAGYRDMLLNLKASNGHVVEMQLHVEQILAVKNGEGHKFYEETRDIEGKAAKENRQLTPEETAQVDAANAKSKPLYDAAYADSLKPKDKPAEKQKAEADKADKKDGVAPELKQEAKKDPVDPKADEHKKISQQIDDKAKKQGEAKQGSADLDRLYAEAEHAYNELKGATAEIAGATGGAAKFPPGLKGRERALEKINADYKGDASKLFDIARSSIEFTSLDALYKALDMVQGRFTVIRIKDRFQSPTKSGYRDMLLNLKTSNGHICEMQLHVEQILAVKNGEGHKLYEETRSIEAKAAKENRPLSEQEKSQVAAADGKAKTLYDNAYADSLKDTGGKKEEPKGEAAEAKAKIEKTVAKEPKPVKPPKDYPEPAVIDQKIDQSIGAGTQTGPNPVKKVAANPGLRKEHEGTGVEYAEMKGEAFVKGDGDKDEVDPNDVKQGSLGDCYLIGGMAAVARANPQYIKSLIKDNGDGTYDVTLYIKGSSWDSKGKPTVVTVDSKFPSGDKGFSAKYSKAGDKGPKGPELWVMLIEKAWAVHKGTYTGIEGGKVNDDGKFAGAIALLTNLNEGYYTPGSIDDKKLAAMIDEALKKGWPVACDSKNLDKEAAALKADADKAGVVGNHAYAPQKVDLQAMTVDLQNPWGSSHVPGLKIADFKRFYRGLRIGK